MRLKIAALEHIHSSRACTSIMPTPLRVCVIDKTAPAEYPRTLRAQTHNKAMCAVKQRCAAEHMLLIECNTAVDHRALLNALQSGCGSSHSQSCI